MVVAHVTLLGPFADLAALDDGVLSVHTFFGDVVPFGFELTGVSQFPEGATYLTPSPRRRSTSSPSSSPAGSRSTRPTRAPSTTWSRT